jgi:hypothetical protein
MKSISLFIILFLFFTVSCKKLGCTDENAMNFENVAQKNDGSCTYEGSVGIWFDSIKFVEYANTGVQSLTYFINGDEKGVVPIWPYASAAGLTCDSSGVFQMDFSIGKASTQSYNLLVKRETGAVIDNYAITVQGGKCTLFLTK